MKPLLAIAAIACALAACSGLAGPSSLPLPTGTEPPNGAGVTEPTGGRAEPGVSGTDPAPGGGGADSVAQLCAQFCNRAAGLCGRNTDASSCASSCTEEVSASGNCQSLYLDLLQCLITQPLTCDGTTLSAPNCTYALIAVSQCASPTPTAGGSPTAAP